MCDRNAKSEYILTKLCAFVFESICERTTKFHEKILFDRGLLICKHRRQNICFQYSVVPKWRWVRTRSTFSRSVIVSVAVSSLWHTDLFFIDQGTKVNGQYYRHVFGRMRPCSRLLVKHQTSSLQLCGQPIVLTWSQYTARLGGSIATGYVTLTSWSHADRKSGNIFH